MYQNYNYYPQTQPNQYAQYSRPVQPAFLKGRLVASIEEARATSIDFDGSIFYFPDLANKRIYTKQINMDGTATLNMYELRDIPTVNETQPSISPMNNYITREEFDQVVNQLKTMLVPEQPQPVIEQPIAKKAKTELKNF